MSSKSAPLIFVSLWIAAIVLQLALSPAVVNAQALEACPIPPFAQGNSASPNILMILDHSGSMGNGSGSRWETAKTVLKDILDAFPGMRFGLMRMDGSNYSGQNQISIENIVRQGGKVLRPAGTPVDQIKTYIDNNMQSSNNPQTWTVLAEVLASAGRYFATVEENGVRVGKGPANFGHYERNYHYTGCGGGSTGNLLEAPPNYDTGQLDAGSQFFLDRTYVIESQPAGFENHTAILTRNNDKNKATSQHIRINLPEPATIYVAYDSRATTLPAWMNNLGFTGTGQSVDTTDVEFDLYQQSFAAGEVILGGNRQHPAAGAGSNYFVYIDIPAANPQGCDATVTDDYGTSIDTTSPILYACQKSFVILITDGLSNYDNDWDLVTDVIGDFDGDGESLDCAVDDTPCPHSNGNTRYLDDVAKYLHDHDLRTDLSGMQNVTTYVVGFHVDDPLLSSAAQHGGGVYYTANNASQLTDALRDAILDILDQISSGTSVATISTSAETDDLLVRAKFLPGSWKGFLEAVKLPITESSTPIWEAGAVLSSTTPSSRTIFTHMTSEAVKKQTFDKSNSTLVSYLESMWSVNSLEASNRIDYVRGVPFPGYRDRGGWLLGDIIHSTPVHIGPPVFYYQENQYQNFKNQHSDRDATIYTGANDGMLHAFNAVDGTERWAFVPEGALPSLPALTSTTCHEYFVDLSPKGADIWDGTAWKTVLCGGGRLADGDDYWCLDVTNPDANAVSILWNQVLFSSRKATTQPFISKLQPVDKWVAFFTSGYDESTSAGKITAVDFTGTKQTVWDDGGSVVDELNLGAKSATNPYYTLTTPNGIDEDNDGYVDVLYAGDTEGNLWKFYYDFVSTTWKKVLLFQTPGQPIVSRPIIALGKDKELVIVFGTGKYYVGIDKTNTTHNAFYAVVDKPVSTADANNGHYTSTQLLLKDTHLINVTGVVSQDDFLALTQTDQDNILNYGWYFNLEPPGTDPGERIIEEALVVSGTAFFTSFVPNENVCGFGGNSRFYAVDFRRGVRQQIQVQENGQTVTKDVIEYEDNKKYEDLGAGLPSKPVFYFDNKTLEKKIFIQTSDATIHERTPILPADIMTLQFWRADH